MRRVLAAGALLAVLLMDGRAGPYAADGGLPGSSALDMLDFNFIGWATGHENYLVGTECDLSWQNTTNAVGPAMGDSHDIVCLGNGGSITMTFAEPIRDADGFDFAVFENGFPYFTFMSNSFLELAYVEVSADGTNFVRFPNTSLTPAPPGAYGVLDPTLIDGLAGKVSAGWGTPFDLKTVGLDHVTHVRLVDIIGTGTNGCFDSSGRPIYDPAPVYGSGGFDLDAVGVYRTRDYGTWCLAHFPIARATNAVVTALLADPDEDGLPNILEYALRQDPLVGKRTAGPRVIRDEAGPAFVFPRYPDKQDIECDVEMSTDLMTWTPVARSSNGAPFSVLEPVPGVSITETGDDVERTVTVRVLNPLQCVQFRLNVRMP
jgi:hypothetical protein